MGAALTNAIEHRLSGLAIVLSSSRWSVAVPVLLMGMFWAASSIPGELRPDDPLTYRLFAWLPPTAQNLLHIPAYAALAFLWHAVFRAWRIAGIAPFALSLVVSVLYGIGDEWHQSFVPGRYASATDATLNAVGTLAGAWLAHRAAHRRG